MLLTFFAPFQMKLEVVHKNYSGYLYLRERHNSFVPEYGVLIQQLLKIGQINGILAHIYHLSITSQYRVRLEVPAAPSTSKVITLCTPFSVN